MVDTDKLRGIIVERGETQSSVAEYLGISSNTMTAKMKAGVFRSDEIEKMIKFLKIHSPMPIFFPTVLRETKHQKETT